MKIDKQELLSVLKLVKKGVSSNVLLGDCFMFHNNRVIGYNGEFFMYAPLESDLDCVVNAKVLLNMVSKIRGDSLEITQGDSFKLSWGKKSEAELAIEQFDGGLPDTVIFPEGKWLPLPKDFVEAVGFVSFSAGTGSSLVEDIIRNSVHIDSGVVETTDGCRICQYEMAGECDEMLIPATTIKVLVDLNPTEYIFDKGSVLFRSEDGVVMGCRLLEAEYPDLDKHVPDAGIEVKVPDDLGGVIAEAIALKDDTGPFFLRIEVVDGVMNMSADNISGKLHESLDIEHDGEDVSFLIQPQYLSMAIERGSEMLVTDKLVCFQGEKYTHLIVLGRDG
jgi:DNA polymerase III sliding clamp (beta) subunit (PCNA family)